MWTDNFIQLEKQRVESCPIISFSNKDKWIMVMNTDENIKKFKKMWENTPQEKRPEGYKVYYNTPEEYEWILEGMELRAELSEKRERERKLINPDIDENILDIKSKQDLINYFLDQRWLYEATNIDEYSEDEEVDHAQLNAEQAELKKLIDKYFKE